MSSFLPRDELEACGFAHVGHDVRLSRVAVIHGADRISIGDHVRIDDFAVVTADEPVLIGDHVHVATGVFLSGSAGVELGDFSGLSPRCVVLSATDDFTGATLTGPTVPDDLRGTIRGRVRVGRHVVVGAGSVVLPATELGEGCCVGALSLVRESLAAWMIHAGVPTQPIRRRDRGLLELERRLRDRERSRGRDMAP